MAKAEKAKAKRKPKPKFTDKAQSERFIEAARKLGVEETDEKFEEALKKVAQFKKKPD
jgi:SET domain-containing protein